MAETVFRNGAMTLGVRPASCTCSEASCPMKGAVAEVAVLIEAEMFTAVARGYLAQTPGTDMAFPMYMSPDHARRMAKALNDLADATEGKKN